MGYGHDWHLATVYIYDDIMYSHDISYMCDIVLNIFI